MAYSTSSPPASSIDDDAPLLLVDSIVQPTGGIWSATEDLGGTDLVESGFPVSRADDDRWHVVTKPNTAATTHYLLLRCSGVVDAIVLLGHNFSAAAGTVTVTVRTADDDAFSTNLVDIASEAIDYSATNDPRMVLLSASQYSGVERLSIELSASGSWTPEIGEVFAGRRVPIATQPDAPYDARPYATDVLRHRARGGAVGLVKRASGELAGPLKITLADTTERDDLRDFVVGTDYGACPFLWLPHPDTDPQRAYVCRPPPALTIPNVRPPAVHRWEIELREMAPYLSSES